MFARSFCGKVALARKQEDTDNRQANEDSSEETVQPPQQQQLGLGFTTQGVQVRLSFLLASLSLQKPSAKEKGGQGLTSVRQTPLYKQEKRSPVSAAERSLLPLLCVQFHLHVMLRDQIPISLYWTVRRGERAGRTNVSFAVLLCNRRLARKQTPYGEAWSPPRVSSRCVFRGVCWRPS